MIAQRISENNIKVVDKIELSEIKTRHAVKLLEEVFGNDNAKKLVLVEKNDAEVLKAFRNIKDVTIAYWRNVNTYRLVENEKVLFTQESWDNFINAKGLK